MAISWSENNSVTSANTLAAQATETNDIDIAGLSPVPDLVFITVEIVFGATTDGDTYVTLYASTDSGTNDDTEGGHTYRIPATDSATKRVTLPYVGPYVAIAVNNDDSTDNVTYSIWYAARDPAA